MIANATMLSLTALSRIAVRFVRERGPVDAGDLVDHVTSACGDRERAEAGIRLALIGGRVVLDRDATVRLGPTER